MNIFLENFNQENLNVFMNNMRKFAASLKKSKKYKLKENEMPFPPMKLSEMITKIIISSAEINTVIWSYHSQLLVCKMI